MTSPARILFAIPELDSGGPDRVFFELIGGLNRSKFLPILLVSTEGGRYFNALPEDVETLVIRGGRYPVWQFSRAIDKLRPDLVITTLRMNITASAAQALQKYRPPLITRQANAIEANFNELRRGSNLKYGIAEWLIKYLLRRSDALVAQSSDMSAELKRYASKKQKISVIGNPVSIKTVRSSCEAQKMDSEPARFGNPALIAVGRLAPQKGFDILLRAFSQVLREHPKAGLTILGDGPDRNELEAIIKCLGIVGSVKLPGHSDSVLAEVSAADIFVSSSRYEGFSNAILEAMALGKLVVATNSEGGTKDMIIDGQTGILASKNSSEKLGKALLTALHSDLVGLGRAGQRHVQAKFSHHSILAKYETLFQELLGKNSDALSPARSFGQAENK